MREHASERFSCLKLPTEVRDEIRPTAPTSASVVGGLMVQLAVKHFHEKTIPIGEAIGYLGNIDDLYRTRWRRNPGCPSHREVRPVKVGSLLELDRTSDELPLVELVEIVRRELGPKAVLRTSFELVETLSCRRCQSRQEVLERKDFVTFDKVVCRACEVETGDSLNDLLRVPEERFEFSGSEPYAPRSLAEIGFAPLDIYTGALDGEELLVEVSGDERTLFAPQRLATAARTRRETTPPATTPQIP
jgi:adenylyltransferase/sulfurtransferase